MRSLSGLTLPLAILAICYLKCRVATNISHWLKAQSRRFKNYIFAKKCIKSAFWIIEFCLIIIPSHFVIVPYFTLWMLDFFQYHQGVKQFGSRSGPTFCFQRLSADDKSPLATKEFNTKQLVDTTFWLKPWLKLISFVSNFFHLAKVLATTNAEPD